MTEHIEQRPRPLKERLKYRIEDLRIRATQLRKDKWYSADELKEAIRTNNMIADELEEEADWLEDAIKVEEDGHY